MGWNIPQNWREVRKQIRSSTQGIPFLDLAEWDRRQKKNTTAESNTSNDAEEVKKNDQISSSCNTGNNNNNNSSKPSDGGHSDNNNNDVAREEEKKDSVEEYSAEREANMKMMHVDVVCVHYTKVQCNKMQVE